VCERKKKRKLFGAFFAFFCSNVRESLQLHSYGLHETRSILLSFFFARAFAFLLCGFFFALARCAYGLPVSGPMRVKLKRNTASEKAVRAKKKKKKRKTKKRARKKNATNRKRKRWNRERKKNVRKREKESEFKVWLFFLLGLRFAKRRKISKVPAFFSLVVFVSSWLKRQN
jgi:hypothetical protein